MAGQLDIDPARSALLSMDYQAGIVSIYARPGTAADARAQDKSDAGDAEPAESDRATQTPPLVHRAASVIKRARSVGMRVIHVRVGFRPNLPEISGRNPLFSAIRHSAQHQRLFQGASGEIHDSVKPEGNEVVITKHRVSAFTGTDLAMILRANDIETMVLFGIATSGVVLATLLEAVDADYRVFVVKDCCADQDPAVHACLVDKVFPRYAAVILTADFLTM